MKYGVFTLPLGAVLSFLRYTRFVSWQMDETPIARGKQVVRAATTVPFFCTRNQYPIKYQSLCRHKNATATLHVQSPEMGKESSSAGCVSIFKSGCCRVLMLSTVKKKPLLSHILYFTIGRNAIMRAILISFGCEGYIYVGAKVRQSERGRNAARRRARLIATRTLLLLFVLVSE